MKPVYEQDWRQHGLKVATVINAEGTGETICFVEARTRDDAERLAQSIAALPDVVRELRHLVRLLEPLEKEGGLEVPGLATLSGARAALKKAGAL